MSRYRSKSWRAFNPESATATASPTPAAVTADLTATVRILGLDPGSRRTGFGVLEIGPGVQRCLAQGRIEVDGLEVQARLARIHAGVRELIAQFEPTEVAVEKVFVSRNVDSALKLGQARGAALAAIGESIELAEYAPRAIKLAVVGFGGADKMQVAHRRRCVLVVEGRLTADAADALAVALCHAHHRRLRALLSAGNA
jgi:crossover junction endodeoxyribonuclease RuvC